MKRETLELHLGQPVTLTIFDGSEYSGILKASEEYKNYYFIESETRNHLFRSSHVHKLKGGAK